MADQDQLELERQTAIRKDVHALDASPKTILVHLQDDETLNSRLESALSLARCYDAHLECLHITPGQAYVAYDSFGGVFVMGEVIKTLEVQEATLRAKVEAELGKEDVSWDYTQITGEIATALISRASLADLIVTGREPQQIEFAGSTMGLLGDLISRSRTPIFVAVEGKTPCDPSGPAVIAWDGSYEAADVVRSSIGMLKRASGVHVVQVTEEKDELFPSTRLLEYLSRHGIHAELTIEIVEELQAEQEFVPDILVARALSLNAAYIVMGGYSHSRIGEYIFGGVTRTMLSASPVPIVIAR
jgi:nucleotide-binding universal stress UspA family protein